MTISTSPNIQEFMASVQERNPHQPEFHQAVLETAEHLIPFISHNKHYQDSRILERLTEPDRIITFRVTWEDDRGIIHNNRGFRVQHCNAIGPYKGGLRFHPSVNESILKFLAYEQTFKNSLTGLPLGGGKGGADFDPKGKSDREIRHFCQAFMTELQHHIGPTIDVPAGDIGVGSREVSYLFGEYKRINRRFEGVITGKGLSYGGSRIRTEATGYGTVYILQQALQEQQQSLDGKVCSISGSGNVALFAAEKLIELGARVVTLSDSSGFIYDKDGLNPEKLHRLKVIKLRDRMRIDQYCEHYSSAIFVPNERPWSVPADCVLPCATQNELEAHDMKTLLENGCIAIAEGANMPVTAEAKALIPQENVIYLPGKVANAGGVAVSGLEMAQNSSHEHWSRSEVDAELQRIMQHIHAQCQEYGQEKSYINYEKGGNVAGFVKVADAIMALGV